MPLRAEMPITVTNPTSEPSDSTPPVSATPTTPPTSENGRLVATSAVMRADLNSSHTSSRTPSRHSSPVVQSRWRESRSAAYSPRTCG